MLCRSEIRLASHYVHVGVHALSCSRVHSLKEGRESLEATDTIAHHRLYHPLKGSTKASLGFVQSFIGGIDGGWVSESFLLHDVGEPLGSEFFDVSFLGCISNAHGIHSLTGLLGLAAVHDANNLSHSFFSSLGIGIGGELSKQSRFVTDHSVERSVTDFVHDHVHCREVVAEAILQECNGLLKFGCSDLTLTSLSALGGNEVKLDSVQDIGVNSRSG